MIQTWLQVTRSNDWMAKLAQLGVAFTTFALLIAAILMRLPATWEGDSPFQVWIVRSILVLIALWIAACTRVLAYGLLPGSPVLLYDTIYIKRRGRNLVLSIDSLSEIFVESRPTGEMFVLRFQDGTRCDLCPVGWVGAEKFFAAASQRIAKHRRRLRKNLKTIDTQKSGESSTNKLS